MNQHPRTAERFLRREKTDRPRCRNYHRWHQGEPNYYLWALLIDCPQILAKTHAARTQLEPYLIDRYQRQDHITIFACGFSGADYDRHRERLEKFPIGPFELKVHGANSFPLAPFLEVEDCDGGLNALRSRFNSVTPEERTTAYVPHITLGIYNNHHCTRALAAKLREAVPREPITYRARALSFCTYRTDDIGSPLAVESEYHIPIARSKKKATGAPR